MANVSVRFNNKDYLLSCDDGQEDELRELTNHLDSRYLKLKKNLGNIGENKLLLITAIKMADDYFALFKTLKSNKENFQELSKKFNELKSLAINYKDEKEIEINKLTKEVNEFKIKVEKSRDLYEKTLDKTKTTEKISPKYFGLIGSLSQGLNRGLLGRIKKKPAKFLLGLVQLVGVIALGSLLIQSPTALAITAQASKYISPNILDLVGKCAITAKHLLYFTAW